MPHEQWQITVTATAGFHRRPGSGRVRYVLWFTAFDTDATGFFQPLAKVMLVSNQGLSEGVWHEYSNELPLDHARPVLNTLRQLGLPDGRLEGGGVSKGSETWDHLSVLIGLHAGGTLRQCVLGGYDWEETLPAELLHCLRQVVALLGEPHLQAWDVRIIQESLTKRCP
jgi:hypothetical protein